MRCALGCVIVLAGCDTVFGLERPPELPIANTCTGTPIIDDELEAPAPCEPWGSAFMDPGTSIAQNNGQIRIQSTPHARGAAGCTVFEPRTLTAGGAIVFVSSVLTTPGAYTGLNFGPDTIQVVNDMLYFNNKAGSVQYGSMPYDPEMMRAWRLFAQSGRIFATYSPDGVTWFAIAEHPGDPTTEVLAIFAGNSVDADTVSGVATFDRVVLCP